MAVQSRTFGSRAAKFIVAAVILAWTAVLFYPLAVMVFGSLKPLAEFSHNAWGPPQTVTEQNYARGYQVPGTGASIALLMLNTAVLTAATTALLTICSAFAAFALARYEWRGRALVIGCLALSLAIPGQALLAPLYKLARYLGMLNVTWEPWKAAIAQYASAGVLQQVLGGVLTAASFVLSRLAAYWGLILIFVAGGLPFSVIILRANFVAFPKDLEEAARIDGCSDLGLFFRVFLPLSRGSLATIATLTAMGIWNAMLLPMIFVTDASRRPLAAALVQFSAGNQSAADEPTIFAILCMSMMPVIIMFFLFQKHILKGLTTGAVKG